MGNGAPRGTSSGGEAKRQKVAPGGAAAAIAELEASEPQPADACSGASGSSGPPSSVTSPRALGAGTAQAPQGGTLTLRSTKTHERIQPLFRRRPLQERGGSLAAPGDLSVEPRPVDPETRAFLAEVMKQHFVFATVQESEYDAVFSCMRGMPICKDEAVFFQGDVGDSCYFIRSGTFSVSIDGKELKQLGPNETFGELALLYHMKRSATITCTQQGELWRMDHSSFKRCMEHLSSTQTTRALAFFRCDANFRGLPESDQRLLASSCSTQHFVEGDLILREGEVGEWMFIILSGKVAPTDEQLSEHFHRSSGAVLGAVALMYGQRQAIGFRAEGYVSCLSIAKSSLSGLTDHLLDVLRRCAVKALLQGLPRGPGQRSILSVLSDEQQHRIVKAVEDGHFEPHEVVMCVGDPAQLIVVIEGEVAIVPHLTETRQEGDLTFCLSKIDIRSRAERILTNGMGYGEQSEFFSGSCMTRFVVALSSVRLHRITHVVACRALGTPVAEAARLNAVKKVLTDIFLFKNLREDQVDRTVRRLEQKVFANGEVIVRQDDPARHFYLIQSGTICVKIGGTKVRTLGRWDYFGERGLLLQESRSATCQALEECVCLVLDADVFFEIVGMFRKELERRMHLQDLNIEIRDLQCKAVVGRGTFGVVRLVHPKAKELTRYALKCVQKVQVVKNSQEKAIVMEREVNAQCYHPCIVQFIKTFQDKHQVYFLTEFLGGGDLFVAIRQIGQLSKLQAQFFSGSIILGIEYLHARGIMYRDLKPENVLLDFEGYAKLVDFGCCKKEFRTSTLIGTPEYLAPEVITGAGYTCAVDWWSLGVMMYEFIVGPLPFGGEFEENARIFHSILTDPLVFPESLQDGAAIAIIEGLLQRSPERRLGAGRLSAKEIKDQVYFIGFKWDALAGGFFEPPWKPNREVLMKQWEPPDGDLMDHVSKEDFSFTRGMEWARVF